MENKPPSSLVMSLGKILNGTPLTLCGRQVALFLPLKRGLVAGLATDCKNKMPGNADYFCGEPNI